MAILGESIKACQSADAQIAIGLIRELYKEAENASNRVSVLAKRGLRGGYTFILTGILILTMFLNANGEPMKKHYLFILFVLLLLCIIPIACGGADGNLTDKALREKLQKPYFAMSYNPEFAARFSLPKEKAIELSDGMHAIAIELRLETGGDYGIYFHLYVDNGLKLDLPNKDCDFQETSLAERFFRKNITDSDYEWYYEHVEKGGRRIFLRSVSLNTSQKGVINSLHYYSVKQNFLPGLTLISMYGMLKSFLDSEYGPAEILIQKSGLGDYLLINDRDINQHPDYVYRFGIPAKLQNHLQPYLNFIMDEFGRNHPSPWDPTYDYI